jgi:hypothetical protein
MELYIAGYLVENGFANDIISALKILKVASDDWYGELIDEALSPEEKAKKRAASLARRRELGKPETFDLETSLELRKSIKQGQPSTSGQRPQTPSSGERAPVETRLPTTNARQQALDREATRLLRSRRETEDPRRPTEAPTYVTRDGRRVQLNAVGGQKNAPSDANKQQKRSGTTIRWTLPSDINR